MDAIERAIQRTLSKTDRVLIEQLEEAGLLAPTPGPDMPAPTLYDQIIEAEDCETIGIKPVDGNPYGYLSAVVYRSARLGSEAVVRFDYCEILRDGRCVGWAQTENIIVRSISGDRAALEREFGRIAVSGEPVRAEDVARPPNEREISDWQAHREGD